MKAIADFCGSKLKVAVGTDHGGFTLKAELSEYFKEKNIEFIDFGPFEFDKEDDIMIDFITACTNIRCEIFHLTGLSKFEVKEKAGNIIPAIPTTNAIISGLMIIEMMKVLSNQKDHLRTETG